MDKRMKMGLCLTVIGLIIIIFASVSLSISDSNNKKELSYLKKTLLSESKQCVIDNKCTSDIITIKDLKEYGYFKDIDTSIVNDESYIIYSIKEISLKEI